MYSLGMACLRRLRIAVNPAHDRGAVHYRPQLGGVCAIENIINVAVAGHGWCKSWVLSEGRIVELVKAALDL